MVKAKLLPYKGAPTIHVNGKPVESTLFFASLEIDEARRELCYREIERAARSGMHIYTLLIYADTDLSVPAEQSNAQNRQWLRRVVEIDPEALIIPRVLFQQDYRAMGVPESENEKFTDGNDTIAPDFISELWIEKAILQMERLIASILADEILCDHIIGYHYSGGETGEWFQRRYWERVLNVSDPNNRCFRRWLTAKYGDDAALSAAWGQDVKLAEAVVPADLPCYQGDFHEAALMEGVENQRFIDYLDYFSDEIVAMLEQVAAAIKRATNGDSLFVTFYGYHFEVPGPHSGHFSLARILRCPDVDILTSPVSYQNRNDRGVGAFMNEAASVQAAGKLWLDESDYRMPIIKIPSTWECIPYIYSIAAAHEVILREYGKLALWGAGTWWMDLQNAGWFDEDIMWEFIAEGRKLYQQMRDIAKPAVSEVYYLIDEKAMSMAGDTWRFATELLGRTRDKAYLTGLSYDLRLIEDFLDGKLDGAKLYIFLTPFRMSPSVMDAIHEKLKASGATALWMFGFGLNSDKEALKRLTGFDFTITAESADKIGALGKTFDRVPVSPLTTTENGEIVGTYPDCRTAFAKSYEAGYPSYFFGGTSMDIDIVRYAARQAGARMYMPAGDCFNRFGSMALLHTATGGKKTINFGCAVTELRSGVRYEAGQCTFSAAPGQTFLFQVHDD